MEYHIPFLLTFHTDVFLKKKSTRQKRYEVFLNYFDLPRLRPSSHWDWYIYYLRIFWKNELYELISKSVTLWFENIISRNHRNFITSTFKLFWLRKWSVTYNFALHDLVSILNESIEEEEFFFFCRRQNVHIFLLSRGSQLTWKWNWLQRKLICNMYRIQFTIL